MKKSIKKSLTMLLIIALIAVLSISLLSCKEKDAQTIKIAVPDGAPALAIANMLEGGFSYENYNVEIEIVAGAAEISAKLTASQADIALIPTNIAAKLYANNVDIKLVATNVYGLLYLVGTENITSFADLKNQKIMCTGQGGTPDFLLKFFLENAGVDLETEADIQYITQGSDAIAALKAGTAKYALLGEPAATMAVSKAGASIIFDLQEKWFDATGYEGYPQAGTVATANVVANHSGFLKAFLSKMKDNVDYIASTDVAVINKALADNNSLVAFSTAAVIERCNIKYVGGIDSKESLVKYFDVMKASSAQFIGGDLPVESFYVNIALD